MHGIALSLAPRALTLMLLAGLASACESETSTQTQGSSDEEAAVEAAIRDGVAAYNSADAEGFISFVTDNMLQETFGISGETAPEQLKEMGLGEPPLTIKSVSNIEIDGDTATADVDKSEGILTNPQQMMLVKTDDGWAIDVLGGVLPVELPEDATPVDLTMTENAFEFDAEAMSGENIALVAKNAGKEEHEMVLLSVPADLTLEELTSGDTDYSDVMKPVGFTGPFKPGESANILFEETLEPGHYVMLCGIPNAEGVPHVALGMISDFTVE